MKELLKRLYKDKRVRILSLITLGMGVAFSIMGSLASTAVPVLSLGLSQTYQIMLAYMGMAVATSVIVSAVGMFIINAQDFAQMCSDNEQDIKGMPKKNPMSDQTIALLAGLTGGLVLGGIAGALASTALPFMSLGLGQTYQIVLAYLAIGLGMGLLVGGVTALAMKFKQTNEPKKDLGVNLDQKGQKPERSFSVGHQHGKHRKVNEKKQSGSNKKSDDGLEFDR